MAPNNTAFVCISLSLSHLSPQFRGVGFSGYMEDNHRRERSPASLDLAAGTECLGNELMTPTNSDSSLALTADNSYEDLCQPDSNATQECPEWSNEKHSSYLDSLEASFIKQLHSSIGLAWISDQETGVLNAPWRLPANSFNSYGQFMVLQDGRWQRINRQSNQPVLENGVDSNAILDNPWVRRFRCPGNGRTRGCTNLQQNNILCSERMVLGGKRAFSVYHPYHHDSVGSIAEVSDQNFVDDEEEEKSSTLAVGKRLRIAADDTSSRDQIVASEKSHKSEILPVNDDTSEREQVRDQWLSEKLEGFICPEHDVKSISRGAET